MTTPRKLVTVAGLERFVGQIGARHRRTGRVSSDPLPHHVRFFQSNPDGTCVDHGIVDETTWRDLISAWQADPRTLYADPVRLTDGRVSYVLYEVRAATPRS
ncbi:MAG: hypothetical protein EHM89_00145 [Acidobacteria bacterium]|nr:MAG: hypothetical protein EHM89_00145 [Acidobacteriota bacterium]